MSIMNAGLLAAISGDGLIHLLVVIVVVGLILWLLDFVIRAIPLQPPFAKVARVILLVFGVLFLVNALLALIGHPIFSF